MTERFAHNWPPIRMDHAIIRSSQSLVKGGGPAAQFRRSYGDTEVEPHPATEILTFRIADIPGPGNLGLSLGLHFFSPACQFCTTVSGGADPHFSTLATRNRCPSSLTAQSRPIRRLKCTLYFFNVDCQFSITVNGGGAFCASGTATRNRFPSAVTSHTSAPRGS